MLKTFGRFVQFVLFAYLWWVLYTTITYDVNAVGEIWQHPSVPKGERNSVVTISKIPHQRLSKLVVMFSDGMVTYNQTVSSGEVSEMIQSLAILGYVKYTVGDVCRYAKSYEMKAECNGVVITF